MAKSKKISRKNRIELVRFAEYFVSGGAYFWTGYLVFFVCDHFVGLSLWWAKLAANITGWIVNFILQRYWVFNDKNRRGHQTEVTGRYIAITLIDFGLDYLIVSTLKGFGLTPYLGQFVSSGFFTAWNYLWYKYWVFPARLVVKHKHSKRSSAKRKKR